MSFLPEELLKAVLKRRKREKKNKQEWATSNKLQHVFKIKQKGQKVCHNKNKYININKIKLCWQDRIMYEQVVAAYISYALIINDPAGKVTVVNPTIYS